MIISFTIFSSIFTYLQSAKNAIERENNRLNLSIIFPLFIISIWEIINLITFDLNISYYVLYIFYLIAFISIILFFTGFNIKYWIIKKSQFQQLINKLPVLFFLLFIAIFFLFFYHKEFTWQSDMWYYYKFMNEMHTLNLNHINEAIASQYPQYLTIGIYQYGSSLPPIQRFYLFPYLTTFMFLFFSSTVIYEATEKFLNKYQWKVNLLYIFFASILVIFYIFYNLKGYYRTIEGDYVSTTYLILLLIPYFLNIKTIKQYSIFLIIFSLLFINESSASLLPFLLFSLLLITILFRKKYHFSILLVTNLLLAFILSIYISALITFLFLNSSSKFSIILPFAVPFIVYGLLLLSLMFFLLNKWIQLRIKKNRIFWKINELWNSNFINMDFNNEWFKNKDKLRKIFIIIYSLLIFTISIFDNYMVADVQANYFLYFSIMMTIFIDLLIITFVWRNKINLLFIFLLVYLSLTFFFQLCFFKVQFLPSFFWQRLDYSSLSFNENYMIVIKDIVITYVLAINTINWKINHWSRKNSKKKYYKPILFSFTSVFITSSLAIPVPIFQAVAEPIWYLPSFNVPSEIFHLGLSENTLNKLNKFKFNNKLTFSDIYLPAINSSSNFNLSYNLYPPYSQLNQFHSDMQRAEFKNNNGEFLNMTNVTTVYKNDIFPYYDYLCIKSNDEFILSIIHSMNSQFKIIDKFGKIDIFENTNLNHQKQELFLKWNSSVKKNYN